MSFLDGRRITQPADLDAWLTSVREGRNAGTVEELSFVERVEELVMLRLRMSAGLDLAA